MPKYNLFLDDIRHPEQAYAYTRNEIYLNLEWQTMRNYNHFVQMVMENGLPEVVSFDHDLAEAHYHESMYQDGKVYMKYLETISEKTGMDCVKWLVDYCIDHKKDFPQWYVHSMNPVGKLNMESYIENYLKHVERMKADG